MHNTRLKSLFLSVLFLVILSPRIAHSASKPTDTSLADTTITVDKVQVTAIKQGKVLREEALAASIVGSQMIRRGGVNALKNLSQAVPNLHIPDYGSRMTSSIYVRGLGARIDQPVMGLNVDNVPMMNKNTFDMELADAERIEVLRGPQSTLYGRNTMGGVINVYTLSPMLYQGTRLSTEYSSGNSYRFRASTYHKLADDLAISIAGFYNHEGGFFTNNFTGEKCDWERMGGGRWKTQWRLNKHWSIDNTLSITSLNQGGYPYAYMGEDKTNAEGEVIIRHGEIAYNNPCGYRRTTLTDGITLRYDGDKVSVSSITSYLYSDDRMLLDQDFTPEDYFTMRQSSTEHALTEDIVIRSRHAGKYQWLAGIFGFYRNLKLSAPVYFKRTGIQRMIIDNANRNGMGIHYAWDEGVAPQWELPLYSDFRNPSFGGAIYHESRLRLGRWSLTAGVRIDTEHTQLKYHSQASLPYHLTFNDKTFDNVAEVNDRNQFSHTYTEVLPKFSTMYHFDTQRNLYLSIARGYKAGGFNTQIFSDILQQKLMNLMASGSTFKDTDIMSYKPEYSWNYEFGGHFMCMEGVIRGDFALFYLDIKDQQLTVFPPGKGTGRMMKNAGKSRSYGAEVALRIAPWRSLDVNVTYGYTNAKFKDFDDGKHNHKGNYVPYSPQHTLSANVEWTHPTGVSWLGDVILQGGVQATGKVFWNEANTLHQPFYALWNAAVGVEHRHYSLMIWGRNLTDTSHDVFYFMSMGNEFVQRGRPRTFGITLNINI